MKRCQQVLSHILVCCMLLSLLPTTALATSDTEVTDNQVDSTDPYVIADDTTLITGTCGDNLTWSLDTTTKTLTISGSGPMENYGIDPTNMYARTTPWFSNRGNIDNVVIEPGVTTIGAYAFDSCDIANVSIPDGVTAIGQSAFGQCGRLTDIIIPISVTDIESGAFSQCGFRSVDIPEGVVNIGGNAFINCVSLKEVKIPASVSHIGGNAFWWCHSLEQILVDENNLHYASENGILFNKDKTELILYPNSRPGTAYIIPNSVSVIVDSAFEYNSKLNTVSIPDSVETIGTSAFSRSQLTEITIPGSVSSLDSSVFSYCTQLETVTILEGVTSFGDHPFSGCTKLRSITLPGSIGTVTQKMFQGCTSLMEVILLSGITDIEDYAFDGCTNLSSITLPETVKTIGKSTFNGCSALTSINIPSSTISIGDSAFRDTCLTSVVIPGSVKSIGSHAFYGCASLASVTLSHGINTIGSSAFSGGQLTAIELPDSVTSIGQAAFSNNKISSVSIPSSVASIGYSAFNSQYLTELNVDPNNISYTSEDGVLFSKDKTTLHSYPANKAETSYSIPAGVISIEENAFWECKKLSGIVIPNSVTTIGPSAFYKSSLSRLEIPNSVTSIGGHAFAWNESLTKVIIPESITSMGSFVFSYCDGLTSAGPIGGNYDLEYGWTETLPMNALAGSEVTKIVIAEGITKLCEESLYRCANLTDLYVPLSVTSMERMAFGDTNGIDNVYYEGSESDWAAIGGKTLYGNTKFGSAIFHYNASWNEVGVTGITLDQSTITLTSISGTQTLTPIFAPENASDQTVTWTSSNESVATVSGGVVTAVAEGTATITATTVDGGYTATCDVTVDIPDTAIPATGILLDQSAMTLTFFGDSRTLTATVLPENATDKTVTWTSSNKSAATVTNGLVLAVGEGATAITATTADMLYSATCIVTVEFSDNSDIQNKSEIVQIVLEYTSGHLSEQIEEINNSDDSDEVKFQKWNELFLSYGITDIREGIEYLSSSAAMRHDYEYLLTDEHYCANNYSQRLADDPAMQAVMLVSSFSLGGEINDWLDFSTYIESDYPGVKKYKAVLLEFMNNVDYELKALKTAQNIQEVFKNVNDSLKFEICERLEHCTTIEEYESIFESYEMLEAYTYIKDFNNGEIEVELDASSGFGKFAKAMGYAGKALKIGQLAYEDMMSIINLDATLNNYMLYQDFLTDIVNSTEDIPFEMRWAANQILEELDRTMKEVADGIVLDIIDAMYSATGLDDIVMDYLKEKYSIIGSFGDWLTVVNVTSFVVNAFVDVSKALEKSAAVEAYTKLANHQKVYLQQSAARFLADTTDANAWEFAYNYEIMRTLRKSGEECYLEMCNIEGFLELAFKHQYQVKSEFVQPILDRLEECKFSQFNDLEEIVGNQTLYAAKSVVECPVDVKVTDSSGEVIVEMPDGKECDIINDYGRFISLYRPYADDYVKVLYFNEDNAYTITLCAVDDGIVSYSTSRTDGAINGVFYQSMEEGNVLTITTSDMVSDPTEAVVYSTATSTESLQVEIVSVLYEDIPAVAVLSVPASICLDVGESQALQVSFEPIDSADCILYWNTSDKNVATVKNGVVTAVGQGIATIFVGVTGSDVTAQCSVSVSAPVVSATGVSITPTAATLTTLGATEKLTATISPIDATNKSVSWTSSRPSVATVSDTGVVTAVSNGQTTITVTTADGGYRATCTVTVTIPQAPNTGNGGNNGGNHGDGGNNNSSAVSISNPGVSNGKVTVSPQTAAKGDAVTIRVTPNEGYELDALSVTDKNGKELKLIDKGDGKYTFMMPSGKVTVDASFRPISEPWNNPFTDVSEGTYYYDAVLWAVQNGITEGTTATTFSPDDPCTRAQMATFLWRAAGSPEPVGSVNPFTDVLADAYYAKAVQWAVEKGITNGTGDGTTFSPDAPSTRAQMATFLWRNAGSLGLAGGENPFADVSADQYYTKAVQWAYEQKITAGTGDGTTFSPDDPCTRAQMVTFLYRNFAK